MIGMEIPSLVNTRQEYKRPGRSITEEFSIHNLREALRAFGLSPVELHGPPNVPKTSGELHLQLHIRSIVHNSLALFNQVTCTLLIYSSLVNVIRSKFLGASGVIVVQRSSLWLHGRMVS